MSNEKEAQEISLVDIMDAWATSQPRPFIIIYSQKRRPPWLSSGEVYVPGYGDINCQWCGRYLGHINGKLISLSGFWNSLDRLIPAEPDFFEKFENAIRINHKCVDADRLERIYV